MTHTPGPWRLSDASEQGFYGNNGELAVIGPELRICNVDCVATFKRGDGYKAQCAERDANARLIAAAPELLENAYAARDTMARAADIFESMGKREDAERLRRGADVCRIHIARARGETA